MQRGDITVLPEYTGALLSHLSKGTAEATDTAGQVEELAAALPDELVLLEPSEAQDQETITCTAEVAEEHGLTSIADLAPVSRQLVFGGPPELPSREGFGLKGLKALYDVEFKTFRPLDVSGPLTVSALKEGKVDCANLFSTQSAIEVNGFVSLTDPKGPGRVRGRRPAGRSRGGHEGRDGRVERGQRVPDDRRAQGDGQAGGGRQGRSARGRRRLPGRPQGRALSSLVLAQRRHVVVRCPFVRWWQTADTAAEPSLRDLTATTWRRACTSWDRRRAATPSPGRGSSTSPST
jgi:hypothetical protein